LSAQDFYKKPATPQRPLLGRGADHGVYMIDPTNGQSQLVIPPPKNAPPPRRASAEYFRKVDNWKDREWRKVVSDSGLGEQQRLDRLQDIQDHYERAIVTGGGDVQHYDVRRGLAAQPLGGYADNDPLHIR